jgi:hypothetical protein
LIIRHLWACPPSPIAPLPNYSYDIITLIAIACCTIAQLQFVITSHAKYTLPLSFFFFFGFVVVCETTTYAKRTNKKEKNKMKKKEKRTINE